MVIPLNSPPDFKFEMKNILLLGAGKSSAALIKFLLNKSASENLTLTIADLSADAAMKKAGNHPNAIAIALDIHDAVRRMRAIQASDIVISLLPPELHVLAAGDCVKAGRHLITASYLSDAIRALDEIAKEKNIILMNECGLDPGIDHMSAMKLIHQIKKEGGEIVSFRSFAGGLVAPECNNNPWGYKFTWNPRNVVLAGQEGAVYLENGKEKKLSYYEVFDNAQTLDLGQYGTFDAYANRNSETYREPYGLQQIKTLMRGTLRNRGFCKAWKILIKLGITDDRHLIESDGSLTWAQLVSKNIPSEITGKSLIDKVAEFCGLHQNDEALQKVKWLGIFEDIVLPFQKATAARCLQHLLEQKWKLEPDDKDMVVMHHEIIYTDRQGKTAKRQSSLVVKGDDHNLTAMAKTVGLPLGIMAMLILKNKISLKGVQIPVMPEVYMPVLAELEKNDIVFHEEESLLPV